MIYVGWRLIYGTNCFTDRFQRLRFSNKILFELSMKTIKDVSFFVNFNFSNSRLRHGIFSNGLYPRIRGNKDAVMCTIKTFKFFSTK